MEFLTGNDLERIVVRVVSVVCLYGERTHNPHPDFKHEPIVTTRLIVKSREREVCINCYYELLEAALSSSKSFPVILEEKLNLVRIFEKQKNSIISTG